MKLNRRKFLGWSLGLGTAGASAAVLWAATSHRRSAQMLRSFYADTRREVVAAPLRPDPRPWSDQRISMAWLGHSTVLINFYGIWILTDPVFSDRVGIDIALGIAGPKRFVAPALDVADLPPIDLVVLSHAHYDHIDLPSLAHFGETVSIATASSTGDLFKDTRLRQVRELGWNDRAKFTFKKGDVEVQAVEVKHWGRRWPSDLERGYNGYILRREGKALLFGGDTAMTTSFASLKSGGPYLAALMPIGAYQPWIRSHCTPEEALQMANAAGAHYIVPIHHQTYKLSDEPMDEPITRLAAALSSEPERLALRQIGAHFVCPT